MFRVLGIYNFVAPAKNICLDCPAQIKYISEFYPLCSLLSPFIIIFQVLSDETDYVGTLGGWASLDPLIQSISKILDVFRKLEFSSEENFSLIKTKAKEVDQKLETLKKLIQTQSDQASLEDYS
jgi:hypothetical protein